MKKEKLKKVLMGVSLAGLIAAGPVGVAQAGSHGTGCGSSCGGKKMEGQKTGCGAGGTSCGGKNATGCGNSTMKKGTSCGDKKPTSCGGTSCGSKKKKTSCGSS